MDWFGWLFWVNRPFETVFQSISGRLSVRGRKRREKIEENKFWLDGCFGFNGPFRQYFSLYRAVSQREGERKEKT